MSQKLKVKIKSLRSDSFVPSGRMGDAGWDLRVPSEDSYKIFPHETVKIELGFSTEIPDGWVAYVFARSGLSTKEGLRPANCVGVIDSSYRGEWVVALHNDSEKIADVGGGDKIAQVVFVQVPEVEWIEADELSETERGEGGFGSTGR